MAYDPSASLKDRFANARQCLIEMFPNRRRPGATYQGLVKAIVRVPDDIAAELYKMRWGVEVFFRSFKQTLGCRKLLSRSPKMACEELDWSLIALLLLGLMGVDALVSGKCDPLRLSVAEGLRTVRHAMHSNWRWRRRGDVRVLLCKAIKDNYRRHTCKKARDWPYKKRETPPGAPKIRPAKPNEIARAKRIYNAA